MKTKMTTVRELIDMLFDRIGYAEESIINCEDKEKKKIFKKELRLLVKAQDALCEIQRMFEEE